MPEMEFTGERFVPGEPGQIKLEHLQRYALCRRLVQGKRVLDIASGEGYGAALLAQTARHVIGVDIDPAAVVHSQRKYASPGRAAFVVGSVGDIPLATGSVDVVVSFETIEHYDQHVAMMREMKRVLTKDGVLVLSSPNRVTYSVLPQFKNRFHVKELDLSELESLLSAHFRHMKVFGQRLGMGCFTYDLGHTARGSHARLVPLTVLGGDVEEAVPQLGGPIYFIAVCSDTPLGKSVLSDSVILEPTDDLYHKLSDTLVAYQRLRDGDEAEKARLQSVIEGAQAREVAARELLQATAAGLRNELERTAQQAAVDRVAAEELKQRVEEALTIHASQVSHLQQFFQQALSERDKELDDVRQQLQQTAISLRSIQVEHAKHDTEWLDRLAALQSEVDVARAAEIRSHEAQRLERDALIRQQAEAARHAESRLEHLRRELEIVYQSKSWRLTAPLRNVRRSTTHARQSAGQNLERPLRRLYFRIPVASDVRWKIKSAGFQTLSWLLKDTASYQRWADTKARAKALTLETSQASLTTIDEQLIDGLSIAAVDDPQVSVVIPVYGQLAHTIRCLRSVQQQWPAVPTEVIVVDDASPDRSREWLSRVPGIQLIAHAVNEGFIRSCNDGARAAAGRIVLFLNNDTEVLPGWCDELWRTFEEVPEAGIVGSKLIYPDGRLQEAGGIIWRDGSGWNLGRLDDPLKPVFNYRRDADYVSGASLAVRRDLFFDVGAFDERYLPAYGEDSDLAFKMREKGYRVLYQPLSQVIHHEGITSGRDLSAGVKKYQVDNARKLFERWRATLADHGEPGTDIERARDRRAQFRALVLDHCTPTPDQDAGSLTALNIMRILQHLGGQITFIPEDNYLYLERYTSDLQRQGIEVLYAPFVTSVEHHLEDRGSLYDLVLIFRHTAAKRHLAAVKRLAPQAKVVLHTSDLHFLREQREAELSGDETILKRAAATKAQEYEIFRQVDAVIVHSTVERELLAQDLPETPVVVFGWAIDVPGRKASFDERADIALVAGYQHPPNVDAALFFASEVFPIVKRSLPGAKFYVVGSNPPGPLREVASEDIVVTGFVPQLDPVLERIRVAVAPIRYGAGIKGKVLTCMSYGLPNVVTNVAAEGMPVVDDEHVLIGNDPGEIAAQVVRLYQDEALWHRLSETGLTLVRDHFSLDGGVKIMRTLLGTIHLSSNPQPGPLKALSSVLPVVTAAIQPRADTVLRTTRDKSYATRLSQEVQHYKDRLNVHDLPAIFHYWSGRYLKPMFDAFGIESMESWFLDPMLAAARRGGQLTRIASLGAGNCDLEVALAAKTVDAGVNNFVLECIDLNASMLERGREAARRAHVEDHLDFRCVDLNDWDVVRDQYAVVIANQSLHHFLDLEILFDKVKLAIGSHGKFVTSDVIGRNGHMRWPEALTVVNEFWDRMPDRYKYNHLLQRQERRYENWDCSKEGFEGIRAQDILPLLLERFHFEVFLGFGNVIDIFIDRAFGHNFDSEAEEDRRFVDEVARRDEALIEAGVLTPTHMMAILTGVPTARPVTCWKHLTPEFCLRRPDGGPRSMTGDPRNEGMLEVN